MPQKPLRNDTKSVFLSLFWNFHCINFSSALTFMLIVMAIIKFYCVKINIFQKFHSIEIFLTWRALDFTTDMSWRGFSSTDKLIHCVWSRFQMMLECFEIIELCSLCLFSSFFSNTSPLIQTWLFQSCNKKCSSNAKNIKKITNNFGTCLS